MTDAEILRMKLNLTECSLDNKQKDEFLTKLDDFHDVFSLRDEIGMCPFIKVHLKLKDETPFFVRPYPMREQQKKCHGLKIRVFYFLYIFQTFQMNRISFMVAQVNALPQIH